MIDPCCYEMRCYGRNRYRGVPEAELPDAIFQIDRVAGAAMMLSNSGQYDLFVQHCPWCGVRIGKDQRDLADYDPYD